jgi:hypothetical protein
MTHVHPHPVRKVRCAAICVLQGRRRSSPQTELFRASPLSHLAVHGRAQLLGTSFEVCMPPMCEPLQSKVHGWQSDGVGAGPWR